MSLFGNVTGKFEPIRLNVSGTSATTIAGNANSATYVAWFQVSAYAGTPTITLDTYDTGTTTAIYFGIGATVYNAVAMTAKQSLLFNEIVWLPPGVFLRVTSTVGNNVMVQGVRTIAGSLG